MSSKSLLNNERGLPTGGWFGAARRRRKLEALYWDFFINTAPEDPLNELSGSMRDAPQGSINSVIGDIHTPEIMSEHIKEIARKFGSDLVGVVDLDGNSEVPQDIAERVRFAVVCVVPAENDPETSPGIGGQVPVRNGLMINFILSALFRESGYFATMRSGAQTDFAKLAVRAGLGTLDDKGRLRTGRDGTNVWVADVIYTDFPLATSG